MGVLGTDLVLIERSGVQHKTTAGAVAGLAAGGATYGTATLDFGPFPGNNEASISFSDTSVTAGAKVQAFIASNAVTGDHTALDHRYGAMFINLSAEPNPGVGGIIHAVSEHRMQGAFAVRYFWSA